MKLVSGSECLRVEIEPRLLIIATTTLPALLVPDLMFLTIFPSFFLVRISKSANRVEVLDMLDGCLITIVDASAPTSFISVLRLLFACSGIAGSWCASKT